MQDTAASGLSLTNPWITGGSIGSKNAVLVFKTSALVKHTEYDSEQHEHTASPSVKIDKISKHAIASTSKDTQACDKTATTGNKLLVSCFSLNSKHLTKPIADSLSSSDNSISSACDDPTDLEADIANAEENDPDNEHVMKRAIYDDENEATSTNKESISTSGNNDSAEDENELAINEMPASVLNITYKFTNTETKLLKKILSSHGLKETEDNQHFNLLWTGLHMKPDILRSLTPYQRVNHFPR